MNRTFQIRADSFGPVTGNATRAVQQARGWQWVRYAGRRFQLFGGIRGPLFINAARPLPRRAISTD